MVTRNDEQVDTSWAAIDIGTDEIFQVKATEYHHEDASLSSSEQEQPFSKTDFEYALKKVSRKVKK